MNSLRIDTSSNLLQIISSKNFEALAFSQAMSKVIFSISAVKLCLFAIEFQDGLTVCFGIPFLLAALICARIDGLVAALICARIDGLASDLICSRIDELSDLICARIDGLAATLT